MTVIRHETFMQLLEELGPNPHKHTAFIASITNTLAGLSAVGALAHRGDETALKRMELMTAPFQDGIPDNPAETRWVDRMAEVTGAEAEQLYERAALRHIALYRGQNPDAGRGFGKEQGK